MTREVQRLMVKVVCVLGELKVPMAPQLNS